MNLISEKDYKHHISKRIKIFWLLFILMIFTMIVIGEMGLGDSRNMTPLMGTVTRVIFFGTMIRVLTRIWSLKRIVNNNSQLQQFIIKQNAINEYNKKLEINILRIVIFTLMILTFFFGLINVRLFNISFVSLLIILLIFLYRRKIVSKYDINKV